MSADRCKDIDISSYTRLRRYVAEVERKLGNRIRFCDLRSHPNPRAKGTHFDPNFKECPAVWVNRQQLCSCRNPEALLAHELTHIYLILVERYPVVADKDVTSKSESKVVHQMAVVLQDLVVEHRLLKRVFDRSADFEDMVDFAVKQQREGPHHIDPGVEPEHRELIEAFDYARLYLSRYAERRHKDRLRKVYKDRRPRAWAYAKHIIGVIKRTSDILEPEGQHSALDRLGRSFDLHNAYVIKVAGDFPSFDEIG